MSSAFGEMVHRLRDPTPRLDSEPGVAVEADPWLPKNCRRATRPVEVYRPEAWNDLIRATLGVADGAEEARRIRLEVSGGSEDVLTSKQNLANDVGDSNDIKAVYRSLHDSDLAALRGETPIAGSGRHVGGGVTGDAPVTPRNVTSGIESADDDEAEPDVDASPPGSARVDAPPSGAAGDGTAQRDESEPDMSAAKETDNDKPPAGLADGDSDLLQRLTAEFQWERQRADQSLEACHARLRAWASRWQARAPDVELSNAVPYCVAIGVLLATLTWTVLPRWVPEFDLDSASGWISRAWTLLTAALVMALFLLNMPRGIKRLQLYLILGSTAILAMTTWLLLRAESVESLINIDASSIAPLLIMLVLALMAACLWMLISRADRMRSSHRVSAAWVLVYLVVVIVAVLNDESFTQEISFLSDPGSTFMIVSSVIAGSLIISSFAVVSIVHYRHELEQRQWREELRWLKHWHDETHQREDAQAAVLAHWLGTAIAIHRLFRQPYGAPQQVPAVTHREGHRRAGKRSSRPGAFGGPHPCRRADGIERAHEIRPLRTEADQKGAAGLQSSAALGTRDPGLAVRPVHAGRGSAPPQQRHDWDRHAR